MNFSNIQQKIENMEYSWTNPQTALLLIPGLSFALQIIQTRKALSTNMNEGTPREVDTKSRKFANICRWSYAASMIQVAACLIAFKAFRIQSFRWIVLVSLSQVIYTTVKGLSNPSTFYEINSSGSIARISISGGQNFF